MFTLRASSWLKTAEVKAAVRKAALARLKKCGYLVEAQAKRLLSKSKSASQGRGKGGRFSKQVHLPSAPGEPPHIDTGNLRASIRTAEDGDVVVVGPTTTAWYGRIHEFGGKHHPKRPFMRPALIQCADQFPAQFAMLDFTGSGS